MTDIGQWKISRHDRQILRELARRKLEYANAPENLEKRRLWYRLDQGQAERPMVLTECEASFEMLFPPTSFKCKEEWARELESELAIEIFRKEVIGDDYVSVPYFTCKWQVVAGDYGVAVRQEYAENEGRLGARRWDPPLKNLQADFRKLKPRAFSVDRESSLQLKTHLEELFGDILPVQFRRPFWWTMGMTVIAIELIGLENLMLFMYDDPEGLHNLMAFLRDDHLAYALWLEKEGLLHLNNESDYIGSGSLGYTRHLPQPDWREGMPVRLMDMWVLLESQETVGVGPEQFEEFVFPYQAALAEKFGSCYYGCCEFLHSRWNVIKKLPNLKRVSISPWCDQEYMAQALGRNYVFSRKPNPTLISTEHFDEQAIREDLRNTVRIARGCNLEIIMKDVHTLCGHPQRMARWVQLARESIAESA